MCTVKLLIDGDILRYRYGFAAQKKRDGVVIVETEQAVVDALHYGVRRMLKLSGCSDYQMYLSGSTNFRLGIDPEYKANRKDAEKPYHYDLITRYLIEMHDAIVSDGVEADDLLAIACLADQDGTVIASIDKDLDQITGWHYDIVKEYKYLVTEDEAIESLFLQMLTGDTVDNVKGIRGVGPVRAKKILHGCVDADAMADVVYREYEAFFGQDKCVEMYDKNWKLLRLLRTEEELPK